LALTYFKLQDYGECLTKINETLTEEPNNVKGLVRRGHAHMMMGNNDAAKDDFSRALQLEPNNADVKKLMTANKKRIQDHKKKERQLYGNMFGSKPKKPKAKPEKAAPEKAAPEKVATETTTTTTETTTESKEKEQTTPAESSEK